MAAYYRRIGLASAAALMMAGAAGSAPAQDYTPPPTASNGHYTPSPDSTRNPYPGQYDQDQGSYDQGYDQGGPPPPNGQGYDQGPPDQGRYGQQYDDRGRGAGQPADQQYDDRDRRSEHGDQAWKAQDDAADACAEAVERDAARTDRSARVDEVDEVNPDHEGWRVQGVVLGDEGRSRRSFACVVSNAGRIASLSWGTKVPAR